MGINVSVMFQYNINSELLNASTRFQWVLGGWGSCSASCGGGRRQRTVACWDSSQGKIVRRKFCSLVQKPQLPTEKCNNYR